ncbi:hypothetical protein G3570_04360 [Balneolaceae bacterium YR4-1]|uniref:Outer membrane protein beta-barrel domain-containing protein n=1 Tax=Halalkalibaculum roseum TaxID=2709311 RepID=A0A6M1T6D0_9BACT|nr:hypothetical protein [Halalkalibaculum roseum]NGP75853.1 hypothetical protein [Halalkalibaculum roseum]
MLRRLLFPLVLIVCFAIPFQSSAQISFKDWLERRKGGYVLITGLDMLPGQSTASPRLWVVNGFQFNRKVSAGLGVGFTYYDDPLSLLPLFIDFKYQFQADDIRPFFFLKSGYNISLLTDKEDTVNSHSGGLMLNPGLGLQFETSGKLAWHVSVAFNLDRATYFEPADAFSSIENNLSYERFSLGVGLSF